MIENYAALECLGIVIKAAFLTPMTFAIAGGCLNVVWTS